MSLVLKQTLILSAYVGMFIVSPALGAEQCFEDQMMIRPLVCDSERRGASADFVTGCEGGGSTIVRVPVDCPAKGQWVNLYYGTNDKSVVQPPSHAQICAHFGLSPSSLDGRICASGRHRPTSGDGWQSILYRYGVSGSSGAGSQLQTIASLTNNYNESRGPGHVPTSKYRQMCYDTASASKADEKDAAVAVFCKSP